ncbi:MAG: 2-hydroxychromene-2-carboxylate isomerase [Hyphomonadaceae bacterium]
MSKPLQFWFEFASTYSYLSVMRIDEEAAKRGVTAEWRPFLLGPIFAAQGWDTSPFKIYKSKGENMWRDMERRTVKHGLAFKRPAVNDPRAFPQHSVMAARIALIGLEADWGKAFCRAVYVAQFAEGLDISDPDVLSALGKKAGAPDDILEQATAPENKAHLRANTDEAVALGLYGAPSFTIEDELFWGDDRLEDALDWTARA